MCVIVLMCTYICIHMYIQCVSVCTCTYTPGNYCIAGNFGEVWRIGEFVENLKPTNIKYAVCARIRAWSLTKFKVCQIFLETDLMLAKLFSAIQYDTTVYQCTQCCIIFRSVLWILCYAPRGPTFKPSPSSAWVWLTYGTYTLLHCLV